MLSIFRTNQQFLGILLVGYALLLHAICFFQAPVTLDMIPGWGNHYLIPWLNTHSQFQLPFSVLTLVLQGVLVNNIVFTHRMTSPPNLFAGVFVILIGCLLPEFLIYSGYNVANVFLLLSLRSYLKAFRSSSGADLIFNSGFWLGGAAFFAPTYLLFLLPLGITLPVLKSGKFRDQLILLLGAVLPLYLCGIYCYWYDLLPLFKAIQWQSAFNLPTTWAGLDIAWLKVILMGGVLVWVLLRRSYYLSKQKMDNQVKINIIYWLLLGSVSVVVLDMPWEMSHWLAMAPIAGFLLSFGFSKMRAGTAELAHLVLLMLWFLLHFGAKFGLAI